MRTRALDDAALNRRYPPETFLYRILSHRTGTLLSLGYVNKRLKLTRQCFTVRIRTHSAQFLLRHKDSNLNPAATLAHHGKPDIDKLFALDSRNIPQDGILIFVLLLHLPLPLRYPHPEASSSEISYKSLSSRLHPHRSLHPTSATLPEAHQQSRRSSPE